MRKTKENLAHPARGNAQMRDAAETANEERAEATGGALSTDGVGSGFDAEDAEDAEVETDEATGDGPMSGEMTDPPTTKRAEGTKKNRKHGLKPPHGKSNHAAANSSKKI